MTTTLACPIQSQLSRGNQMDDPQLQELVRAIQASTDRRDPVVRKQIDRLLKEVSSRLQLVKQAYIDRLSKTADIESIAGETLTETLLEIIRKINRYQPKKERFMIWVDRIWKSRFIDIQLRPLVRAIQASTDRQAPVVCRQINRLLIVVSSGLQSTEQAYITKWSGIANIENIVADAVQKTLLEAIKNIDSYQPEKAHFLAWINGIFRYRFYDELNLNKIYVDKNTLHDFEMKISEDNFNSKVIFEINAVLEEDQEAAGKDLEINNLRAELRKFIEEDSERIFASTHIRNRPDATFQRIMLMRLVPMTWQRIADSLNITSLQTIKSFHDHQLHKYKDYFRRHLQE